MPFFRFFQQVYLTRTLEGLFELVRRPSRAPSLAWYHVQEAMESSAFPKIIRVKLMKYKIYQLMNISMFPKIIQMLIELYVSSLEISGKRPFPFSLLPRGKWINQKRLKVKTL